MTEAIEKPVPKKRAKKKPPTQTAGVGGIDAHGGMGEAPVINWQALINLPAFEMFVQEQSGHKTSHEATEWVRARREALSDSVLYDQYSSWHKAKGYWVNETPDGKLI